ncbi:ATP-dependent RNA helicase supv3l1, mitochondrial [Nowakowskiella sp. JEL0407]|nr:ATP-dependent RNA helicase supv3l1, mitochondrial [Nowakowskiella sp. JEL0407]
MEKFDGQNQVALTASHTKQIAGRAGRFASEYESGLVTTVDSSDLPFLRQQLKAPLKDLESAGILPTIEQIEQFAVSLPGRPLHVLLILFEYATRLEGNYNLCNLVEQKRIAEKLKDITALSLRDRYTLTMAPFPYVPKKSSFNETLIDLVELAGSAIAERRELLISEIVSLPEKLPDTPVKLKDLEFAHKKIILYLWLSFRFPHTFTETTLATQLKHQAESMINTSLERLQFTLRKKQKMASFADLVAPNPLAPPKNMEEILSSPVKDDLSSSQAPESVEETVTILQKGIGLGLDDPLRHAQDSERY